MSEEKDRNLINFIAATVEATRDRMDTMQNDLSALKDQMATKNDLAALKDQMATKKELAELKDQMATNSDLAALKDQMATKNDVVIIRGDIEQVQVRLDSIDHALSGRMGLLETQISRLRSVIYLLVKDKPDMLRLLGQPTPGESRPQG